MDLGVLERTPEAGDVGAIDDLVAGFVARAERFASRAVSVRAAGEALVSVSVGAWATALGERSGRLAAGMDDAARGCRQVAQVLAGYGTALRGLERRVMTARHEVATARIRAVAAQERYAEAVLSGGSGAVVPWSWMDAPDWPAVPQAAGALQAWKQAVADLAEALRAFDACCAEREELDRDTASALVTVEAMASYAPGTGVDAIVDVPVVQALAAAGAGAPMTAAQRRVLGEWFGELVERVSDHPEDARVLADLVGFVETWGDDPGLMSGVFVGIGGAGVMRLLTRLGEDMVVGAMKRNASLADAGGVVRSALATASSGWSPAEAAAFAGDMVRAASCMDGTLSAIGYVFADPRGALMSETFTVAMADLLDAIEQRNGAAWRDGPGSPGQALHTVGRLTVDVAAAHDAAARVLGALGFYPQAARDWLTADGVDWVSPHAAQHESPRISYWFGTRGWGRDASDGFAGIGQLWAAVQLAPGVGDVNHQVAVINGLVFESLSRNSSLLPGHLSPRGSEALAGALAGQLPTLIPKGFEAETGANEAERIWSDVAVPYLPGRVVTADVERTWVAAVMTAATSEASGRQTLQSAVLAYQDQALHAVGQLGVPVARTLETVVSAWAAVDGASVTAAEARQYLADEQTKAGLETARTAVDTGIALSPARPMTAIGVDAALDLLQKQAEARLIGGELPQVSQAIVPQRVESLHEFVRISVEEYERAGLWDRVDGTAEDTTEQIAKDFADAEVARYKDVVDAMRQRSSDRMEGG